MTALSADRATRLHKGEIYEDDVYQSTTIYGGGMVVFNATGYLVPGSTATGLIAAGVATQQADNSAGSSGDIKCKYRRGPHSFVNSAGGDEITIAEIGDVCFIVDDQTVAKTDGSGTRSAAGKILGIDEYGQVIVEIGVYASVDGDLVASNNLSDVASAATSRANIGANLVTYGPFRVPLDAASVYYLQAGVAGDITRIDSVMTGALTGGDPTITAGIEGTPITGGVLTLAASGSGAAVKDAVVPSAANTVAVGDYVSFTVADNSQTNAEYADVTILIET